MPKKFNPLIKNTEKGLFILTFYLEECQLSVDQISFLINGEREKKILYKISLYMCDPKNTQQKIKITKKMHAQS